MMKANDRPFNVADDLDNGELIAEYLAAAAGLGRESLYKARAPGSRPRSETIRAVMRALNVKMSIAPAMANHPEYFAAGRDPGAAETVRRYAFSRRREVLSCPGRRHRLAGWALG